MKTLNFLTTGAAAAMLLLGSCTKDVDNLQGGRGDGVVVEGLPTYATVTLSQRSGAGTYAGVNDYVGGNSEATAEEKTIASAAILVFNQNDILENYVKFTDDDVKQNPVAKTFTTTTGTKRLFVVANLPATSYTKLQGIFEGKEAAPKQLTNICKIIEKIDEIATATTNNQFYMSNVYPLNQTTEPQVTVLTATQEEVNNAAKNNFTIYIGRMTGKVTPTFNAQLTYGANAGGEIAVADKATAQYRVRNNPKRFYTFPVYEGFQLTSPYYNRKYTLPTPTNYDDADDQVGTADFFDNGTNVDFGKTIGLDSYLTENSPKDAKRHKVTFLSIKAKWTPNVNATFLKADGTKVDNAQTEGVDVIANNNAGTFWRVQKWQNGKIIGYCPGIYVAQPQKYYTGDNVDNNPDGNGADLKDRVAAKADQTDAKIYVSVEYTNGQAYWAYWMKSTNNGAIAEKYALKRNNHYKVNIISVDGVGEPTEDDNLDKEEDIEADTHMKATIEVLKWNEVNIEGGI